MAFFPPPPPHCIWATFQFNFHLIFFPPFLLVLLYTTLKLCIFLQTRPVWCFIIACTLIFFFQVKESMNLSELLIIFVNKVLITQSRGVFVVCGKWNCSCCAFKSTGFSSHSPINSYTKQRPTGLWGGAAIRTSTHCEAFQKRIRTSLTLLKDHK